MSISKEKLLEIFNNKVKEIWTIRRIKILVEISAELDVENAKMVDITYSMETNDAYTVAYYVFTLHFVVNGEEVLINFFMDQTRDYYNERIALSGKYVILDDDDEDIFGIVGYIVKEKEYPLQFEFLKVLEEMNISYFFGKRLENLNSLYRGYEEQIDEEFYNQYKHILSGVAKVTGALHEQITLTLISGYEIVVYKDSIIEYAQLNETTIVNS